MKNEEENHIPTNQEAENHRHEKFHPFTEPTLTAVQHKTPIIRVYKWNPQKIRDFEIQAQLQQQIYTWTKSSLVLKPVSHVFCSRIYKLEPPPLAVHVFY